MRYAFAGCLLDTDLYRFWRQGAVVPVEPQVFDLLRLLVENPGRIVTKDEIVEAVWQGRIVSDATISGRVSAARTAVGDTGQDQAVIRTQVRRGFELVVPVVTAEAPPTAGAPRPAAPSVPGRQRVRYATSADGTGLAWSAMGSGPPLLRLGHHLTHLERDWQSRVWTPEFTRLTAAHQLVRYDLRGCGLSDPLGPGNGLAEHCADIAAVADAAGLDRFPILATLQATCPAIRFIAENPGRVSRLVIQCGYARGRALREGAPAEQDADPGIALLREGWGDPTNGYMRAWLAMFMPTLTPENATEMIELFGAATRFEDIVEQRKAVDRFDARPWLDQVTIPTLVIHPRNCASHPLAEGQIVARGIPDAELMVIEGSNIVCLPDEPDWDTMMSATLDFLATDGAAAGT